MTTPSSTTGAADPLAAGAAVDALAIGIGAGADVDVAGALDAAGADPAEFGDSGFVSLLPHANTTPKITHAIVFVMRASKHDVAARATWGLRAVKSARAPANLFAWAR
jgi:hypothetical protein